MLHVNLKHVTDCSQCSCSSPAITPKLSGATLAIQLELLYRYRGTHVLRPYQTSWSNLDHTREEKVAECLWYNTRGNHCMRVMPFVMLILPRPITAFHYTFATKTILAAIKRKKKNTIIIQLLVLLKPFTRTYERMSPTTLSNNY